MVEDTGSERVRSCLELSAGYAGVEMEFWLADTKIQILTHRSMPRSISVQPTLLLLGGTSAAGVQEGVVQAGLQFRG